MNVNTEKIKARAADIAGAIEKIKTYANLPDEQFWADERKGLKEAEGRMDELRSFMMARAQESKDREVFEPNAMEWIRE